MSREDERLDIGDASAEHPVAIPSELPILPLRDTVLFPNSFLPLAVARESSVRLIEEAINGSKLVGVFTQRDASIEEPTQDDMHRIGTATHIHKMFKLPDGSLRLIVQGLSRLQLESVTAVRPYLRARVKPADDTVREEDRLEIDALQRNIKTNFQHVVSLSPLLSDDLQALAMNITEPGRLADFIASSLATLSTAVKQEVLETVDVRARLDLLNRLLIKEAEVLELGSKIQSQVQSEVGKNQREYFLREQMKAIQKELGEGDDQTKEIEELREKIEAAGMPEARQEGSEARARSPVEDARRGRGVHGFAYLCRLAHCAAVVEADRRSDRSRAHQGRARCRSLRPREGEGSHPRIPGGAEAQPDDEGADPVLRRASRSRQNVAREVDREFAGSQVRARVAGRHARRGGDPRPSAHLHRRAARARSSRACAAPSRRIPVFILDEIDKLGSDFRGDPSSALLEVLDPEQNNSFRDHYLDVPFDLSEVLFVTTANVLDTIPPPLRDRMEVLELPGYTEEEKLKIATEHLVAKQVANHGLTAEMVTFTDDAIRLVIRGYTREAGVRNLERELASLIRKIARRRAEGREEPVELTRDTVVELLGAPRFLDEEIEERTKNPGRGDRHGMDAGGRRGALHRGVAHAGCWDADADRPSGRCHEGVGAGRRCRGSARTPRSSTSIRTSTSRPKSTCTFRRAPSRRMVRRRV